MPELGDGYARSMYETGSHDYQFQCEHPGPPSKVSFKVGEWSKAARAAGLRFGVTSHGSHAWSEFEISQGDDKKGDLAGVPYDGKGI